MSTPRLSGEFVESRKGRLLVTVREPADRSSRGAVLVVPAFAEEMNKSRPLLRDLGCALARTGHTLLIPDLYGTGDSDGAFEDASLETWIQDLDAVQRWSEDRGIPVLGCIAIRFGALLLKEWLETSGRRMSWSVLWQPVSKGEQVVNQWLRIRSAAAMFEGRSGETVTALRQRSADGESLECGGYALTPGLIEALSSRVLNPLIDAMGAIRVLEIGEGDECSPVVRALVASRPSCTSEKVPGDPFWAATEISRNAALVAATHRFIESSEP